TTDRGKEFSCYAELEKQYGIPFYFADPYAPWQRTQDDQTIQIVKTDVASTGENIIPIAGAVFTITPEESHKHVGTFVGKTDETGKVTKWFKGEDYPTDDLGEGVIPPRAKYTLVEKVFPKAHEGLDVTKGVTDGLTIDFTKSTTTLTVEATNKKIKRDIKVFDTCTLGERVYEIHDNDNNPLKDSEGNNVQITLAKDETSKTLEAVEIPAGDYQFVQVSTTNSECKQIETPTFSVTRLARVFSRKAFSVCLRTTIFLI
ncbi:MAG: hypothetical protein KIG60_03615, partial [Caryophanon sp.]|nr:hypothetical protein [Caryophanon sp.]